MPTYPDPTLVINGQQITWSRLNNNPVLLQRTLNTLVQQRLIGRRLLTNSVDATGTGAVVFEQAEAIFAKYAAEKIDALQEYPNTASDRGPVANVQTVKWGFADNVPDELVARLRGDEIARKLIKMANQLVFQFDGLVLSAVASAVTQTQAGAAAWGTTNANPFADIMNAIAAVDTLNRGYNLRTIALSPTKFAALATSPNIVNALSREGQAPYVTTGNLFQVAGLTFIKTTNMPSGVSAIALDPDMLGSIAYEELGGGYVGPASEVQTKQFRLEKNDGVRLQMRLVQVPLIQEPQAAIKLTGI